MQELIELLEKRNSTQYNCTVLPMGFTYGIESDSWKFVNGGNCDDFCGNCDDLCGNCSLFC